MDHFQTCTFSQALKFVAKDLVDIEAVFKLLIKAILAILYLFLFDRQFLQDAIVKSGRSPPDSHVPPFAMYELGVLYAQDGKVSSVLTNNFFIKNLRRDLEKRLIAMLNAKTLSKYVETSLKLVKTSETVREISLTTFRRCFLSLSRQE